MKLSLYESIIKKLRSLDRRNSLSGLRKSFPDVSEFTLKSIVNLEASRKTKKLYHRFAAPANTARYYEHYKECVERGDKAGFLIDYADELGMPPALLAKLIIEKHYETEEGPPTKQRVSQMLRDSATIDDGPLSVEVFHCIINDDHYGPLSDAMRSSVGLEYEVRLKAELKTLGLVFVDEDILRTRGYDKTPDIKLEIPVAIDGTVITWIESKALFGDPITHQAYCRDQYLSYWNRFGCGLVIYWLGYVEELDLGGDDGIILRDHMPTELTRMEVPQLFT